MKVLVADESSLYRTMLKRLLEPWGYEAVLAENGCDAQHILDGNAPPQFALLDCLMPGLSVFELCQRIRARKQAGVYTILLSPDNQQSTVLKAFELGADDYLCKPINQIELRTRLKAGEIILQAREQALREAHEASVDSGAEPSLNGLPRIWNRGAIVDLLRTEVSRAGRLQTSLSVLLTDLDFIQRINHGNSHPDAPTLLRDASEGISAAVRHCDHIGRYEGNQLLVVLPNCTADAAREVAERVWHHLSQEPVMNEVDSSVGFGLSQWHPGLDVSQLLHHADVALQRARQNGRYRVEVENTSPEPPMEPSTDTANLQKELRHMLRSGLNRRLQIRTFHQGRPTLFHGRIRNISQDGMGAVVPCSLQINEYVALTFAMEDGRECTVSAVVRHCQGLRSGFKFICIEPSLREAIARIGG